MYSAETELETLRQRLIDAQVSIPVVTNVDEGGYRGNIRGLQATLVASKSESAEIIAQLYPLQEK